MKGDTMSTELAIQQDTGLSVGMDQTTWTDSQVAALSHIGVENASPGDLEVFFHVVKRTGLDPFARQIYMIGRQASEKNARGDWVKVTKQTIQTGIDGYRLIGHRAAAQRKVGVSVGAPEWAADDGTWRPLWSKKWGEPLAARVTITRAGHPFTAVALFDEYAQTKRDGALTQMWAQRPAGQVAKCAEALAWRMAFPQDLAGMYVEDELHHADAPDVEPQRKVGKGDFVKAEPAADDDGVIDAEISDEPDMPEPMTKLTRRKLFALFAKKGIPEADQLSGINHITGGGYDSRSKVTEADALLVIERLKERPDVEATVTEAGGVLMGQEYDTPEGKF